MWVGMKILSGVMEAQSLDEFKIRHDSFEEYAIWLAEILGSHTILGDIRLY